MTQELTKEEMKLLDKLEITRKNKLTLSASYKEYDELTDRISSKIAGVPYWPISKKGKFPQINGNDAKLVFQLNLNEISEEFDLDEISAAFPKTGILQFYFAYQDELYGLYDDKTKPLVIYHSDINEDSDLTDNQIKISLDNEGMPFSTSMRIDFTIDSELLGPQDEFYQNEFKDLFTSFDTDDEDFMSFYYEHSDFSNQGSKIGGYAYFTQSDPFVNLVEDDKLVLLLQLDSDDDEFKMMWGDTGVANWRIFEKDLANLDFSNIIYTWDCC